MQILYFEGTQAGLQASKFFYKWLQALAHRGENFLKNLGQQQANWELVTLERKKCICSLYLTKQIYTSGEWWCVHFAASFDELPSQEGKSSDRVQMNKSVQMPLLITVIPSHLQIPAAPSEDTAHDQISLIYYTPCCRKQLNVLQPLAENSNFFLSEFCYLFLIT